MADLTHPMAMRISSTTGENQVAISQTGTENKFQLSQTSGQNGVDIVKIAGAAPASVATAGSMPVEIKNTVVPVEISSSGTPKYDYGSVSDIDPDLEHGIIAFDDIPAGVTGKLLKIHGFAQNNVRVEIQTVASGTPTTRAVTGNNGGGIFEFTAMDKSNITQVGAASNNKFQLKIINLDSTKTTDAHASYFGIEE